jgi:hypothetical protein
MAEQEISYDAILRSEIAIELLNQARAIVTARVYEVAAQDPQERRACASGAGSVSIRSGASVSVSATRSKR